MPTGFEMSKASRLTTPPTYLRNVRPLMQHVASTNLDTTPSANQQTPIWIPLSASAIGVTDTPASRDKGEIRVTELRTLDELRSIEQTWCSLQEQTPGADYFRTPQWLETYIQHFGDEIDLKIVVISEGDQPTGILPLVVAPFRCSLGQFRVLTYPLDWWGTFYGPIGSDPNQTFRVGMEWIQQQPRDWDFLELRFVNGGTTEQPQAADSTADQLQKIGFSAVVKEPAFHCARIDLKDVTWDEYLASRRKSWKTNIRRTENKTRKLGEVEHIRYRPAGTAANDDDPRWDLFEECSRLSRMSWQGISENTHTFAHPNVDAFLRSVHEKAISTGHVDMNLLTVDGKAVAYHYGYHYQGYFSSLRLGFDPEFSKQGVGTVLTSRMIQDSIELGDHTFDFLPDCLKAKLPWQTSVEVGYRHTHFPSSIGRNGLLRLKRWFDRDVRKTSNVPT